jgi:flagellar basal body rod protein FlgC
VNIAASSAYSGMRLNLARMDASASRVAGQAADPINESIEQLDIKNSFDANAAVLKTAMEMDGNVVRLWA